jgi:type I restriction enzyme S subunit
LVPEGWDVKSASIAMEINPATKVPKEGFKAFLAMNCLSDGSMLIDKPSERAGNSGSKFRNGDTLFARITPCLENGKTGFVQFLSDDAETAFGSTEFIVLRSRTLTPEFVYLLARSNPFRDNAIKSMVGASGRQRVREACFDTFMFAHPDQDTLSSFESLVRPIFRLVQSLAMKNANLRITRDLLLPKLISGEIDISAMPEPEGIAA